MIMRSRLLPGGLALGLTLLMAATSIAQSDGETKSLSQKPIKKWNITAPVEGWNPIRGAITIATQNDNGFAVENLGNKLNVDTNADGKVDQVIKGTGGLLMLKAVGPDGKKFRYTLRIRKQGQGWEYATSGVMSGKYNGTKIRLIDLNGNGNYNEVGVDGMIVGKSKAAAYLSSVVNIKGALFNFEVNRSGSKMTLSPYTGKSGILNLRRGMKVHGKLVSAVVQSGDYSFDLAKAKKGLLVPVGEYSIVSGLVTKGSESARIRQGRMKPLVVTDGNNTALAWGVPLRAEIGFTKTGTQIKIPPAVKYFGKAGEEYYNLYPDKASPKLFIKDAKTGKLVSTARFGGC